MLYYPAAIWTSYCGYGILGNVGGATKYEGKGIRCVVRVTQEKWLPIVIAGSFVLIVVISWLAGQYFTNQYRATSVEPWHNPKTEIEWRKISPELSLRTLEGAGSQVVFDQAMTAQDLDTAYATLVYAVELAPEQRAGMLLRLAQSETARDRSFAPIREACYEMVAVVATVSPDLSDWSRAMLLMPAGRGVADLGAPAQAIFYLDQVYAIVRYSAQLTEAHRQMLLDELAPLYIELGLSSAEWQTRQTQARTVVPSGGAAEVSVQLERPQLFYSTDPVIQAAAARQQMAKHLRESVVLSQGEILPYQTAGLASVLEHEDRVRQQSYEAWQGREIDRVRDRVAWLTVKSRIAHKGFGLSIVPEWEQQRDDIDAALRMALDELLAHYQELASARVVLLTQLEYGLLGYEVSGSQQEWAAQLDHIIQPRLHVAAQTRGKDVFFFLGGD